MKNICLIISSLLFISLSISAQCPPGFEAKMQDLEVKNQKLEKQLEYAKAKLEKARFIVKKNNSTNSPKAAGTEIETIMERFGVDVDLEKGDIRIDSENRLILDKETWGKMDIDLRSRFLQRLEQSTEKTLSPEKIKQILKEELNENPATPIQQRQGASPARKAYLEVEKLDDYNCSEVVNNINKFLEDNSDAEVHIVLKKFEAGEINAMKNMIKLKNAKLNSLKQGKLSELMTPEFDFNKAKIEEFNLKTGDEPTTIMLSIPQKDIPAVKARITVKSVAKNLFAQIKDIIYKLFTRAKTENFDFFQELKKQLKDIGIDEKSIDLQVEDCIICISPSVKTNDNDHLCQDNQTAELPLSHSLTTD